MKTGSGTGLFEVDAGGGEGEIDLILLHDVHDVQVQVVLLLQKNGIGVGLEVGGNEYVDAGIAEAGQPDDVRALVGVGLSSSIFFRSAISCSNWGRVVL